MATRVARHAQANLPGMPEPSGNRQRIPCSESDQAVSAHEHCAITGKEQTYIVHLFPTVMERDACKASTRVTFVRRHHKAPIPHRSTNCLESEPCFGRPTTGSKTRSQRNSVSLNGSSRASVSTLPMTRLSLRVAKSTRPLPPSIPDSVPSLTRQIVMTIDGPMRDPMNWAFSSVQGAKRPFRGLSPHSASSDPLKGSAMRGISRGHPMSQHCSHRAQSQIASLS